MDLIQLSKKIAQAASKMEASEQEIFLADIEDAVDGVIEDYA